VRLARNGVGGILVEELVDLGQRKSITNLQFTDDEHLSGSLQRVVGINLMLYANLSTSHTSVINTNTATAAARSNLSFRLTNLLF